MGEQEETAMYKQVAEKQVNHYKSLCQNALDKLREELKKECGIRIRIILVGSGARNMVTRNGNGPFDLDYNLVLSSIPKKYTGSPEKLKTLIREILNNLVPANFSNGKDSTSAITYLLHSPDMKRVEFKMDVALVLAGKNCYNKLVHDKKTGRYIWNKIRKSADLEPKLNAIKAAGCLDDVTDIYYQKKNRYLSCRDNDHPSFVVYIEAVNEVYQKLKK